MGIYRIEKVNSLPEQVQENKENIKQINEILENIDPEQVATILSDISALKAEQVVQNTAIGANTTAIGANTTAIGDNTTLINNEKTARKALIDVDASDNTQVKSATGKTAGVASDTASFVDSADSGIAVSNTGITLTTDKEDDAHQVRFDNSGNFQISNGHVLEFNNSGAITIDGQPIGGGGGGGTLYKHTLLVRGNGNNFVVFEALLNDNTPINTTELLLDLLKNKQKNFLCNGNFDNTSLCYLGYYSDTEIGCRSTTFGWFSLYYTSIVSITDVINTITL